VNGTPHLRPALAYNALPMAHDGSLASQQQDTTPKAAARYLERLRATPPRERLARALKLSAQVRAAAMVQVEKAMPGATHAAHAIEFVRRVYGEDLALKLQARLARR
jgi:hypothetical protein